MACGCFLGSFADSDSNAVCFAILCSCRFLSARTLYPKRLHLGHVAEPFQVSQSPSLSTTRFRILHPFTPEPHPLPFVQTEHMAAPGCCLFTDTALRHWLSFNLRMQRFTVKIPLLSMLRVSLPRRVLFVFAVAPRTRKFVVGMVEWADDAKDISMTFHMHVSAGTCTQYRILTGNDTISARSLPNKKVGMHASVHH